MSEAILSLGGQEVSASNPVPFYPPGGAPRTFTPIAVASLTTTDTDLVADPGDGNQAGIAEIGFYNSDTVTRYVILKHGVTVFRKIYIQAGETMEIWLPPELYWKAAESTAIVATVSATSVIEVTGGRSFVDAV